MTSRQPVANLRSSSKAARYHAAVAAEQLVADARVVVRLVETLETGGHDKIATVRGVLRPASRGAIRGNRRVADRPGQDTSLGRNRAGRGRDGRPWN
jgi:hypothetical protein